LLEGRQVKIASFEVKAYTNIGIPHQKASRLLQENSLCDGYTVVPFFSALHVIFLHVL